MTGESYFTPSDNAIFIAATTVGNAESFLGGRSDASTLYANALKLRDDLAALEPKDGAPSKDFIDHIKLLLTAMAAASSVKDAARLDRWRDVMAALAKIVRLDVADVREAEARRRAAADKSRQIEPARGDR